MRKVDLAAAGDVVIREMLVADLDRVMALEHDVFDTPWTVDLFIHELKRAERTIYLVAESGGRVFGYIGAQVLGSEVHITNMAVDAAVRRRGFGSNLLIACLRRGTERGARWLTLEVRQNNREARAFYRLFGFDEIGLRRGYYADSGENALIMVTGDISAPEYRELINGIEAAVCGGKGEG